MGWEKVHLPRAIALLAGKRIDYDARYDWTPDFQGVMRLPSGDRVAQDSPNHDWDAVAVEYVRAVRYGTVEQVGRATIALNRLYSNERTIGLWTNEQTCPIPHDNLYVVAMGLALVGAIESGDAFLESEARWHWTSMLDAWDSGATASKFVCLPGRRVLGEPNHVAGTGILRVLYDRPQEKALAKADGWDAPENAGVRFVRDNRAKLGFDGMLAGAAAWKLKYPMRIVRDGDAILGTMQRPKGELGDADRATCDWMLCRESKGKRQVEYGNGWQKPAPLGLRPGGRAA